MPPAQAGPRCRRCLASSVVTPLPPRCYWRWLGPEWRSTTGVLMLHTLDVPLSSSPGRYRRFMQIVDELLQALPTAASSWIARDVDIALFQLGGTR